MAMESLNAARTKTVLCVDDEPVGLRVRKILLESHGFHVLVASNGEQGLELFRVNHIDVVVLDYYMPGMNGADVAAKMRHLRPEVPIILLSAYFALPQEATQFSNAFLTKGDPPELLVDKVFELTDDNAAETT